MSYVGMNTPRRARRVRAAHAIREDCRGPSVRSIAQGGGALAIAAALVFSGMSVASADEGAEGAGATSAQVATGESSGPPEGAPGGAAPAGGPPAAPPAAEPAEPPTAESGPPTDVGAAPPAVETGGSVETAGPPADVTEAVPGGDQPAGPQVVVEDTAADKSEKAPVAVQADNDQVCEGLSTGHIEVTGDQTSITITAPEGMLIASYCVKAGSANQEGGGPETYPVDPPASSVTIAHSSGKEISHYSVSYVAKPPVSPPPPAGPPPAGPPPAGPPPAGPPPAGPPVVPVAPVAPVGTQPLAATGATTALVPLFAGVAAAMLGAGALLFLRARRAAFERS